MRQYAFFIKDGTPLQNLNNYRNTDENILVVNDLFAPFLRNVRTSTPRQSDINHYLNFPKECDAPSYPARSIYHYFCVGRVVYDTRVEYDANARRFIIYAQSRNAIWTDLWTEGTRDQWGEWDSIWIGPGTKDHNDAGADGILARRIKLFAISRTENPLDGFDTYAIAQNVYRDWPWMAINGDHLILSHLGAGDRSSTAATLIPLKDLRSGKSRPRFINYNRDDLNGAVIAEPPRQHGDLADYSLLIGRDANSDVRLFALPHPSAPYAKAAAKSTLFDENLVDLDGVGACGNGQFIVTVTCIF